VRRDDVRRDDVRRDDVRRDTFSHKNRIKMEGGSSQNALKEKKMYSNLRKFLKKLDNLPNEWQCKQ